MHQLPRNIVYTFSFFRILHQFSITVIFNLYIDMNRLTFHIECCVIHVKFNIDCLNSPFARHKIHIKFSWIFVLDYVIELLWCGVWSWERTKVEGTHDDICYPLPSQFFCSKHRKYREEFTWQHALWLFVLQNMFGCYHDCTNNLPKKPLNTTRGDMWQNVIWYNLDGSEEKKIYFQCTSSGGTSLLQWPCN